MSGRKRHGESGDETWEIDGVSEKAREAAGQAAADSKVELSIWLAETVLRASQEGVGGETSAQTVQKAEAGEKPKLKNL